MESIDSLIAGILETNEKETNEKELSAKDISERTDEYSFKTISKHLRIMVNDGRLQRGARKKDGAPLKTYYYSIIKKEAK